MSYYKDGYQRDEDTGRKLFSDTFGRYYDITFTTPRYDTVDFYCTATTDPSRTYVGDIKCYHKEEHPRPYSKFVVNGKDYGYQIDYAKCDEIVRKAESTDSTPILAVFFSDCTLVWDLSKIDWRSTKRLRETNKDGQNYGLESESSLQVYLYRDQAKYRKEVTND